MKLNTLNSLIAKIVAVADKFGYLNALNQLRSSMANLKNHAAQPQTAQNLQNITRFRQQVETQKSILITIIDQMKKDSPELFGTKVSYEINLESLFGDSFISILQNINDSTIDKYVTEINQIYTTYTSITQLNNILRTLKIDIPSKELNDDDRLDILFDGGVSVENLKDLSKESSNWNQHIICFSKLARENDTEAKINSIERGSLLLTVTLVSGTIIAVTKTVDKVLDTIMKSYEVRKKSLELKKMNLEYLNEAITLLDKHSKLNVNQEAEQISNKLLEEYGWKDSDELYFETKTATKNAVKKLIKFLNSGGKIDAHVKTFKSDAESKALENVKIKNKKIKEIEEQMNSLSKAKEILLLDEGDDDEKIDDN